MSRSPLEDYENIVIRAVMTNDNNMWAEAHAISCVYTFSTQQIEACHANVERWLRLHGVTKMNDREHAALLIIQSTVRRWLTLRFLRQQFDMYSRLAKFDNPDHCKRAMSIQQTVACAWEQIHSR